MTTVTTRFFESLLNTISNESDAKAIKDHLNAVNTKYFGNPLKASKAFQYFTDLMGTRNSQALSKVLKEAVGPFDQSVPLHERVGTAIEQAGFIPTQSGWSKITYDPKEFYTEIYRFPLAHATTDGTEDGETSFTFSMLLYFKVTPDNGNEIEITAALGMYNAEMGIIELPQEYNISDDFGGVDAMFDSYIDAEVGAERSDYGSLESMEASDAITQLLGVRHSMSSEDNFWAMVSGIMLSHVTQALSPVADGFALVQDDDDQPVGGFSDMAYHTFFKLKNRA